MNKTTEVSLVVVGVIVVGVLTFFAGIGYQKSHSGPTLASIRGMSTAQRRQALQAIGLGGTFSRGGRSGNGTANDFASGSIISTGNGTITVALNNPGGPGAAGTTNSNSGTRIILIPATAQITKAAAGTSADLTPGTQVSVSGTDNTDGSITAQTIAIRPARPAQPASAGTGSNVAPAQ